MERFWALLAVALPQAGYGVAGTGVGAGTAAKSAPRQAAQDQVRQQIDGTCRQAAGHRRTAGAD
jgi:hypothetical protein